jgi:prepilin-type N-terminal cleavage/methylation domain-containing protein
MRTLLRGRLDDRDDQGMTLVELMVTSVVLLILLGMVLVSMDVVSRVSTGVSSQFEEFDQAIPALTPFHSLLGAEVEPAPPDPVTGTPTPGYSVIGNFALTFYANIGTGYNNTISCASGSCANGGTTAGPAKIQASLVDSTGAPATSCNPDNPCNLQVRMYLPLTGVTGPGVSTCPGVSPIVGAVCQYSPTDYRLLANVQDVVNDPSNGGAGGPPLNPIFSYSIFDTTLNQTIQLSSAEVDSQTITGLMDTNLYTTPYPLDTQSLTACASATADPHFPTIAIACPADAIQSVSLDLQIAKPGAGPQGTVENSLIVYRYAESPGATSAPFQYSAAVG